MALTPASVSEPFLYRNFDIQEITFNFTFKK